MRRTRALILAPAVLLAATQTYAQVDSVNPLVSHSILAFGYTTVQATAFDPVNDTAWAFAASGAGGVIRKVTGVSTPTPTRTDTLLLSQINIWARFGDPTRTASTFSQGFALNPAPVGSVPAFGSLWFSDTASVSLSGSSTGDPNSTPRIWRYNLQSVPAASTNVADFNAVATRVISQADIQTAAGQPVSTLGTNSSRQPTFAPDGQWLYMLDNGASTRFPGIYRINPLGSGSSAITRLSSPGTTSTSSEPAVAKVGSLYRVYYRSANNTNGVTYVDDNPATNSTSAEVFVLTPAQIQDFAETTTLPVVSNLTADAAGNLYFNDTGDANASRLYRLDPQGRLSKVTTRAERNAVVPGTGNPTSKLQAYTFNHPTAGPITRIAYNEIVSGYSAINAFKPTDFDRDGLENAADASLFLAKLTTRGASSALTDARFDLNGNGSIDWRDVKTFQTFRTDVRDGDANMDGLIDFADLNVLRDHYLGTGKTWAQGDFASATANYPVGAPDANTVNYTDLLTLSNTWLNVLSQPKPTIAQLDANGYADPFRADVITAFSISLPVSWTASGSGLWSAGGNWSTGAAPGGAGAELLFGNALAANASVDLGGARTAGSVSLDNATRSYTLSNGTLTLDATSGPALLTISSGSHAISAGVALADPTNVSVAAGSTLTASGTLSRGTHALTVSGGGALALTGPTTGSGNVTVSSATLTASTPLRPVTGSLSVTGAGATATLAAAPTALAAPTWTVAGEFASVSASAGGSVVLPATSRSTNKASVLVAGSLSLTSGGFLDLTTNDAVLRNTTPETVRLLLASSALRSSSASVTTTLGYLSATTAFGFSAFTTFDGVSVNAADVVVKYTYKGDTDLNGLLDARDLNAVLRGWSNGLTGWANGDSDHDGDVDAADWSAFLTAYSAGLPSLGSPFADGEGPGAAIPEPAALSLFVPAALALSRRRR